MSFLAVQLRDKQELIEQLQKQIALKVEQREKALEQREGIAKRQQWAELHLSQIDHQLSLLPNPLGQPTTSDLITAQSGSYSITRTSASLVKQEISGHNPLVAVLPCYGWFTSQLDPKQCISQYNKNMKAFQSIRNRWKSIVIKAYERAPKEKRESAISVVSYSKKNKPKFNIRIDLSSPIAHPDQPILALMNSVPNPDVTAAEDVLRPQPATSLLTNIASAEQMMFGGEMQQQNQSTHSQDSECCNEGQVEGLDIDQLEMMQLSTTTRQAFSLQRLITADPDIPVPLEDDQNLYEEDEDEENTLSGFQSSYMGTSRQPRSRTNSLNSKKSSNGPSSQTPQNRRRKDPYQRTNRFKFSTWEDQILCAQILERYPRVKDFKDHLVDREVFQTLCQIQEENLDRRPIFELVRRCLELIDHEGRHKQFKTKKEGKSSTSSMMKETVKRSSTLKEEAKAVFKTTGQVSMLNEPSMPVFEAGSMYSGCPWSLEEEELLIDAVERHGKSSWGEVSNYFDGRKPTDCRYHYTKIDPNIMRAKPWESILNNVKLILGKRFFDNRPRWAEISDLFFSKTIKDTQCNERYQNILDQNINHAPWTPEDDTQLLAAYAQTPNEWQCIASKLSNKNDGGPRRTDSQCKRRYHALIRMKAQAEKRARIERQKQIKRGLGKRPVPHAALDQIEPQLRMTETDSNKLPLLRRTLGRKRKERAKNQLQAIKTTAKIQKPIKLVGGDFANPDPPISGETFVLPKKRGRKQKMNPEDKPRAKMLAKLEQDESDFLGNALQMSKPELQRPVVFQVVKLERE